MGLLTISRQSIPSQHCLGLHCSRFSVGAVAVEILGDSLEAVELGPKLRAFASDTITTDIQLHVMSSPHLRRSRGRVLFDSGSVWTARELDGQFVFDFVTERFGNDPYKRLQTDARFSCARVTLNQGAPRGVRVTNAFEYPMDELLITHHMSVGESGKARGVELHGCGLLRDDGASFLFVGHSGAGKSTTAQLWTRHMPVEVLSDDRIIVRPSAGLSDPVGGQQCPPHTYVMYGTPWHGEAAFAAPRHAPLQRIFLLEHGTGNGIVRLSRSAAAGELLARSFVPFYLPRFVDPVLALLEDLVESVPCYRFHFVPDRSAVERIHEFRD